MQLLQRKREREALHKERSDGRAEKAQVFIKASGFASEKETGHMISDGNITQGCQLPLRIFTAH